MSQTSVRVALGQSAIPLGQLTYQLDGRREFSYFAYDDVWLTTRDRFAVSPDLPLVAQSQFRKAPTRHDSVFHFAFADTEPDGWGCRVIARDHAKRRQRALRTENPGGDVPNAKLTEIDYLLGVDDASRIGALRLVDAQGNFLRATQEGERTTPPLLELAHLMGASRAVEMHQETEADLRYLRGRGTSLGGMRPKCSVLDEDGHLAIGKFPSVEDDRSVTRGEVLALQLARAAGITVAEARIVMSEDIPVALIRRFDRAAGGRIPYLSAGSMLQASRDGDYAYSQIAECILANGVEPRKDLAELWRRMVFSLLITNVDDHVQNHGFLHAGHGQWRLSPAFDINPFPDKDPELKLWLDEDYGPVDAIDAAMDRASIFHLSPDEALRILAEIVSAVRNWREIAAFPSVGMGALDLNAFAPAFENSQMRAAIKLVG
ncbi:type II toxin-antitoxin system HipA family toxin [Pandoraea pneumonica]|uniref:type II toxin-antitoxin system HipA family toxin n=1 Tax=Pandoraea pneumonica TaxID=2508299 RepID=UPI003CF4995C